MRNGIKLSSALQLTQMNADKLQDLECLEKISSLIKTLDFSDEDLAEKFNEISNLAKKIKYKDSSADYIRNKYGFIDRNKNSFLRQGGLEINYLEALSNLEKTINFSEKIDSWKDDLKIIEQKISLIFEAEKDPKTKTLTEVYSEFALMAKPQNFIFDVGNAYSSKIAQKLLAVIRDEKILKLDFQDRQDRYYFSNVLLKVGELSRELIDFVNPNQESGLFSFFKKIRNNVTHNINFMSNDLSKDQEKALLEVRNILMTDFALNVNNLYRNDFSNLGKFSESEKSHNNELFKSIFGSSVKKSKKTKPDKDEVLNDIINHLRHSIDEIDYLDWIIQNQEINPEKKNYILEYGIIKIANSLAKVSNSNSPILETHSQSAKILQESWLNTIKTRNEKIAHGAINFDVKDFYQQDFSEIVTSMRNDLASLHNIIHFLQNHDEIKIDKIAASDFIGREDLISLAECYYRIGNKDEAEKILLKCLQGYDLETPFFTISEDKTLFQIIREAAKSDVFLQSIIDDYFIISQEGGLYELYNFSNKIINEALKSSNFYSQFQEQVPVMEAIESLSGDEKDRIKLLLSLPYFSTKRRVIKMLNEINYDNQELSNNFVDRLFEIEKEIYGEVSQSAMIEKSYLLKMHGKDEESKSILHFAIDSGFSTNVTKIESLVNLSEALGKEGSLEEARQYLNQAEEISNLEKNPIIKLITLSKIARFEAYEGGDMKKALDYLDKAHNLFFEEENNIRRFGNLFITAKRILAENHTDVLAVQYNPKNLYTERDLNDAEINRLNFTYELVKDLYDDNQDSLKETWQNRVNRLFVAFHVASTISPNNSDLRIKAQELNQLYGSSNSNTQEQLKKGSDLFDMGNDMREISNMINQKRSIKEISNKLNVMFDKIIEINQNNSGDDESNKKIANFIAGIFSKICSVNNPQQSIEFLNKSFALKDLFSIEKTKDELFKMAGSKIAFVEEKPSYLQEAILLLEQAKTTSNEGQKVRDIDVYNFCGNLYEDAGNFREAIKNFQFVFQNSDSDINLKAEANDSISRCISGAKLQKIKFEVIENLVQEAYNNSKSSNQNLTLRRSPASKEDVEEYLQIALGISDIKVENTKKGLTIELSQELTNVMNSKSQEAKQNSRNKGR